MQTKGRYRALCDITKGSYPKQLLSAQSGIVGVGCVEFQSSTPTPLLVHSISIASIFGHLDKQIILEVGFRVTEIKKNKALTVLADLKQQQFRREERQCAPFFALFIPFSLHSSFSDLLDEA